VTKQTVLPDQNRRRYQSTGVPMPQAELTHTRIIIPGIKGTGFKGNCTLPPATTWSMRTPIFASRKRLPPPI